MKTQDGETIKLRITDEHPVHLEGWDGKPRGDLLVELNALGNELGDETMSDASTTSLFPSDEKTAFGDWVKVTLGGAALACRSVGGFESW